MTYIDFTGKAIPPILNAEPISSQGVPLQDDKPIKTVLESRVTMNESAVIGEPTGIGTLSLQTKSVPNVKYDGRSFGPAILDKQDGRPHAGSNAAPVAVNGGANGNWL
jgi:hypothetical protein